MPQTTWIDDVRGVLKREHGKGWSVQQQSGKIKLVRRLPGQSSKQAITTQLPWRASSQTKLLSLVVVAVMRRLYQTPTKNHNQLSKKMDGGEGKEEKIDFRFQHIKKKKLTFATSRLRSKKMRKQKKH